MKKLIKKFNNLDIFGLIALALIAWVIIILSSCQKQEKTIKGTWKQIAYVDQGQDTVYITNDITICITDSNFIDSGFIDALGSERYYKYTYDKYLNIQEGRYVFTVGGYLNLTTNSRTSIFVKN